VGTGASYNFVDTTAGYFIGGRNIIAEFFNGYISNFRYVLGTAVYSGTSYTVPTSPLYPIAGTELFLKTLYGPYFAQDYSTNNYQLTNSGSGGTTSTSSTLNPFS
jgi:hypothetical protein